jgi:hypothetical protein
LELHLGKQPILNKKNAYNVMIGRRRTPEIFSWVWKSSCRAKHNFFFWLLLLDRLNTRNLLARKFFNLPSYLCATLQCNQEETLVHLFWTCPFAELCWNYICPQRTLHLSVIDAFYDVNNKLNVLFSMEIIISAAWGIWIVRNNKIFKNQTPIFRVGKLYTQMSSE